MTGGEAAEVRLVVMVTVPPALVVAENEADVDFTKSDWEAWKILISAFLKNSKRNRQLTINILFTFFDQLHWLLF